MHLLFQETPITATTEETPAPTEGEGEAPAPEPEKLPTPEPAGEEQAPGGVQQADAEAVGETQEAQEEKQPEPTGMIYAGTPFLGKMFIILSSPGGDARGYLVIFHKPFTSHGVSVNSLWTPEYRVKKSNAGKIQRHLSNYLTIC